MADEDAVDERALDESRLAAVLDRDARSMASLKAGRPAEALKIALQDPPLASKDEAIKERNAAVVMRAISAVAAKDDLTASFLAEMSPDDADCLMKYIYRGLQKPDNSATLLKLHAQVLEKAGMGCIVRAIVDRKTA